jgi:hypothetical protein
MYNDLTDNVALRVTLAPFATIKFAVLSIAPGAAPDPSPFTPQSESVEKFVAVDLE